MPDYYATLRIQQGRLKSAMTAIGVQTVAELSRRTGVQQGTIGDLLNFKRSPRSKKSGEWTPSVVKLCQAFTIAPNELFPDHLDHEVATNRISAFVEHAQLRGHDVPQLSPAEEYDKTAQREVIDSVLNDLTERERDVLQSRFLNGEETRDIAKRYALCDASINAIEHKALRKLRHPFRVDKLREVVGL